MVMANSRGPESLEAEATTLGIAPATVADAVAQSDIVVFATPWGKTPDAAAQVTDWTGKIVVDTTNNRSAPGPDGVLDIGGRVSSEVVADLVPGASVVKAFNHNGIPFMLAALNEGKDTNALFISGDDPAAKATVSELVTSIGGAPVDAGTLSEGGRLQGTDGPLSANPLEMLTPDDAHAALDRARSVSDSSR